MRIYINWIRRFVILQAHFMMYQCRPLSHSLSLSLSVSLSLDFTSLVQTWPSLDCILNPPLTYRRRYIGLAVGPYRPFVSASAWWVLEDSLGKTNFGCYNYYYYYYYYYSSSILLMALRCRHLDIWWRHGDGLCDKGVLEIPSHKLILLSPSLPPSSFFFFFLSMILPFLLTLFPSELAHASPGPCWSTIAGVLCCL